MKSQEESANNSYLIFEFINLRAYFVPYRARGDYPDTPHYEIKKLRR